MAIYVLDTSAVIAVLDREPGGADVRALLDEAAQRTDVRVLMPFMTLMEVNYQRLRTNSEEQTEYWLGTVLSWPVEVIESTPQWRPAAARVKAQGGLSLGDAWIAALALLHEAELIHKDPEFDKVDGLQALRLPYDRDTQRGVRG